MAQPSKPKSRDKTQPEGKQQLAGPLPLKLAGIAKLHRYERDALRRALSLQGAPPADDQGRYSVPEVIAWMEKHGTSGSSSRMKEYKEAIAKAEAETASFNLGVKRGAYVERVKIAPTISAFMTALTVDMQNEFERILPGKCVGRTEGEIRKLAQESIDRVLNRLKHGARPLLGKESVAA